MKIRAVTFVLLMIMLFSIAVSGQDECKPNLLIGGIWQTAEDQAQNRDYARLLDAEYLPTYYSLTKIPDLLKDKTTMRGSGADVSAKIADVLAVRDATPSTIKATVRDPSIPPGTYLPLTSSIEIELPPDYKGTDLNGLNSPLISKGPLNPSDHYNTIYAHSGGARTAVTALLYQDVTADKLVLISPANGGKNDELYKEELQKLLDSKKVKEIVLYQSTDPKDDAAFAKDLWQTRFEKSDISGNFRIEPVTNKQLIGKKGKDGHLQMWHTVINSEISHGQCSAFPPKSTGTQLSGTEFSAWMRSPISKTTSGLEGWGNHPKGWGVTQEYVNAHPEIYGGLSQEYINAHPEIYGSSSPSYPQSGSNSGSSGPSRTPTSNDQSNPNGLTLEQQRAIQDAIDNMQPIGEDNHYESTVPQFAQCYDGGCYDANGNRVD